jgi:hypothetical protein
VFLDILLRQPSDHLRGQFPAEIGQEKLYYPTEETRVRVDDRHEGENTGYYLTSRTDEVPDWMGSERTDYATIEYFGVEAELHEDAFLFEDNLPVLGVVRKELQVWVDVRRDFNVSSARAWRIRVVITAFRSPIARKRRLLPINNFSQIAEHVRQQLLLQPVVA